jgi:hypothetical protein
VSKADRFRTAGLALVLVGGAAWLAFTFSKHEPIVDWLFSRYATYWALSFGWLVACLSAGGMALDRLTRRTFRLGEGLALGFGLGVLVFFLGMFAGDVLHLYRRIFLDPRAGSAVAGRRGRVSRRAAGNRYLGVRPPDHAAQAAALVAQGSVSQNAMPLSRHHAIDRRIPSSSSISGSYPRSRRAASMETAMDAASSPATWISWL